MPGMNTNQTTIRTTPFYTPTRSAADWQPLLAQPERHWKTGYSARSLAYSWAEAAGFPQEVRRLLNESGIACLDELEFLLGIPEHEVPLPGGTQASQNDVFVLAKGSLGLVTIAVEGKVSEPFAEPVDKRFAHPTPGDNIRLPFLLDLLQLERSAVGNTGYQLLHRTASAILEARRFGARHALMLVHSFSQELKHFDDYAGFVGLYGHNARPDEVIEAKQFEDVTLYLAWCVGDPEYLAR